MKWVLIACGALTVLLLSLILAFGIFAPPEVALHRAIDVAARRVSDSVGAAPYSLHFVELDDDGYYADGQTQKQAVLESIQEQIAAEKRAALGTLILLYVHGLNHDASEGDENVACFDELLKAIARMQAPRRVQVAGVYVGWPGRVYDSANLNSVLAYFGREAAADRVSERGDLLDLFSSLSRERWRSASKHTRFIILGHSLGGRATYRALRPIMQRSMQERAAKAGLEDPTQRPIADVTVFANPAFSADEHRTMHRLMTSSDAGPSTVPRFILATSERDEVLLGPFQVAQQLLSFFRGDYTLDQTERWEAAGQYTPYLTHDLRLEGGDFANPPGRGRCPTMSAEELGIFKGKGRLQDPAEPYQFATINHYSGDGAVAYSTKLRRIARGSQGGESMVLRVDEKIIPNHNDIFTTPMIEFIVRILNCTYPGADKLCERQLESLDSPTVDGGRPRAPSATQISRCRLFRSPTPRLNDRRRAAEVGHDRHCLGAVRLVSPPSR